MIITEAECALLNETEQELRDALSISGRMVPDEIIAMGHAQGYEETQARITALKAFIQEEKDRMDLTRMTVEDIYLSHYEDFSGIGRLQDGTKCLITKLSRVSDNIF